MLDVLEVIAPVKQFSKLREFLQSKLPPGFPVKIGLCEAVVRVFSTFVLVLHTVAFVDVSILGRIGIVLRSETLIDRGILAGYKIIDFTFTISLLNT